MDHVKQRLHGIHGDSADHGSFFGVQLRNDQTRNLLSTCLDRNGQRPANAPNPPSSDSSPTNRQSLISFFVSPPRMPSAIESGALFLNIRRRKIDDDVGRGMSYPQFLSAAFTRSRLSRTAASERPTVWKWSSSHFMPETSTSTSMMLASMP